MSKKEKTTLMPKLRFPEFKAKDDIVFRNGNLIFEPISNKNHNSDLPILAITQEYGAIPRNHIDYNVSVTEKSLESYKIVEIGDFIISLRSFQGGIEYSMFHGICSPAYIILRKKVDIVDQYYKHYFKTNRFIQDLNKDLEGIRDGKMVSYSQFSSILIPKPDKKEQQKIADCLSSTDDLITVEAKKLDALKRHKKGLMQKLFPAEGKTLPQWRFPEFVDDWNNVSLIDIVDKKIKWSFTGGPFGSNLKSSDYTNDGIRVIQLQNIGDGKFINNYSIFTSKKKADELLSCNIYPNEIIMSKMGDPVGRACIVPNVHSRYLMCSDGIRIVVNKDIYNLYFIYSLINSSTFRSIIENNSTGSTRKRIALDSLKNLQMTVPKIEEQEKIADCLSSLDKLISAQVEKIEALKFHKKGLTQGLFPFILEVSK
ncbi:restriction endonuclease subunit S [Fusibacter sp. 3D3]|uniref:restriction endonuclease subunit S n=1 Tax=Fusibacter sp. 3D3 TaxID=1048380 RepID=UPI000853B9F7|nr:restriction endonuclease subunit S [Fusibacter sp. 3D3]GAU76660.1 type I restriction-modification system specificity subunit S [Fusibacter sp. 3D3]